LLLKSIERVLESFEVHRAGGRNPQRKDNDIENFRLEMGSENVV